MIEFLTALDQDKLLIYALVFVCSLSILVSGIVHIVKYVSEAFKDGREERKEGQIEERRVERKEERDERREIRNDQSKI